VIYGWGSIISGVLAGELRCVTGTVSATRAAAAGAPVKAVMFAFEVVDFSLLNEIRPAAVLKP